MQPQQRTITAYTYQVNGVKYLAVPNFDEPIEEAREWIIATKVHVELVKLKALLPFAKEAAKPTPISRILWDRLSQIALDGESVKEAQQRYQDAIDDVQGDLADLV